MSEITKLYENAGIEKEFEKPAECVKNPYISCDGCMLYDDKKGKCNNKKDYPSFTAEKQIELIKWLVKHRFNFMVYGLTEKDFTFEVINKRLKQPSQFVSLSENNFEEGLAKVLNCFWQDLTEEEKQQVKEILK